MNTPTDFKITAETYNKLERLTIGLGSIEMYAEALVDALTEDHPHMDGALLLAEIIRDVAAGTLLVNGVSK